MINCGIRYHIWSDAQKTSESHETICCVTGIVTQNGVQHGTPRLSVHARYTGNVCIWPYLCSVPIMAACIALLVAPLIPTTLRYIGSLVTFLMLLIMFRLWWTSKDEEQGTQGTTPTTLARSESENERRPSSAQLVNRTYRFHIKVAFGKCRRLCLKATSRHALS